MHAPVDLTNLRSMTDGDKELETALFEEFFKSFSEGLEVLHANLAPEQAEIWRKQAHAMKGISLNLGAETLGNLCKNCQEADMANHATKEILLQQVEAEYAQVRIFMETQV